MVYLIKRNFTYITFFIITLAVSGITIFFTKDYFTLLFFGKSFEGRSNFSQALILSIFITALTTILFSLIVIFRKKYPNSKFFLIPEIFLNMLSNKKIIIISFWIFQIIHFLIKVNRGYLSSINTWVYTDWLIDYSAGFVRRGLSGELIKFFELFSESQIIISTLISTIFLFVVLGFVRLVLKSQNSLKPVILIGLLFLPSLINFYVYDYGAFGRKETLGYIFVLSHLFILEKIINTGHTNKKPERILKRYLLYSLPITSFLLPLHIFIHESSFFLFLPVHLLISFTLINNFTDINFAKKIIYTGLLYLPVVISFSAVFAYGQPSFDTALNICKNLELRGALSLDSCSITGKNLMYALPGSLTALPWSFEQALSKSMSISLFDTLLWVLDLSILGLSTTVIGINIIRDMINSQLHTMTKAMVVKNNHVNIILIKYYILPLLISVPLYFMGWDMGRWFTITSINFVLIILSKELMYLESKTISEKVSIEKDLRFGDAKHDWKSYGLILFLLFVILFIRLPHCCIGKFGLFSEPLKSFAIFLAGR